MSILRHIAGARFPNGTGTTAERNTEVPFTENGRFVQGGIQISPSGWIDGLILEQPPLHEQQDMPWLDATGCTVLPGFIDVHIHGCDGHDMMDASSESLHAMSCFLPKHGVTAFFPTTMTADHASILRAVQQVREYTLDTTTGTVPAARILGIHVEGPYISPGYPGAQDREHVRDPNMSEFIELADAGPIGLITLAPERPNAERLIVEATNRDIVAVVGHTAATYDEINAAVLAGVSQATHTYNAMSGLHHRRPGTLGAVLTNDDIFAQLISDTIHVHPAAMRILARCKGPDHTILITDAIRAAGQPDGKYDLGGQTVTVSRGECRLADGTLAGSVLTMDAALRHFLRATGWSLEKGWVITSRTPARAMGIDDEYGSVAPGFRADLVVLDSELAVVATIVGGELVYLRNEERLISGPQELPT